MRIFRIIVALSTSAFNSRTGIAPEVNVLAGPTRSDRPERRGRDRDQVFGLPPRSQYAESNDTQGSAIIRRADDPL